MPLRWVSQSSRYRRCDGSAVRQSCHSSMAAGLAVGKLPLPSSSDSSARCHLALGSERLVRFCPRGGRELMKFAAIHVDRSHGQHAVSEPVSCRGDPPPLKGKQTSPWRLANQTGVEGVTQASRLEGDGLADTFQSCCRGADRQPLPFSCHRHKHDTRSPMLGVREADEYEIFDTRYRRRTAALLRNLVPPSTLCCFSVSGRGEETLAEGLARAPTGAAASRPHGQLALACDRRADAIGLACFYGNQTLGSGHGINTGLRVRPHSGGGGSRWPAALARGANVNNQAASCGGRGMACQ